MRDTCFVRVFVSWQSGDDVWEGILTGNEAELRQAVEKMIGPQATASRNYTIFVAPLGTLMRTEEWSKPHTGEMIFSRRPL